MTMIKSNTIHAAGGTDKGRRSSQNEDFYVIDREKNLFLLADGMGGYRYGEVASRVACELFTVYFDPKIKDFETHMKDILVKINSHLYNQGAAQGEDKIMGTTFLACVLAGRRVHLCHAGDVRAYVFRRGRLKQLTRDHSTIAEMVALGYLSAHEARSHPLRHIVNRSLGAESEVTPDYNSLDIRKGDTLLLCSDGLWTMVEDKVIRETLEKMETPEQTVEQLINLANQAGGTDNITAIIITLSRGRHPQPIHGQPDAALSGTSSQKFAKKTKGINKRGWHPQPIHGQPDAALSGASSQKFDKKTKGINKKRKPKEDSK
jgi:protein phosphatase